MSVTERLRELGIELPEAPAPVGSYLPALESGGLLFLSGVIPFREGMLVAEGTVGRDVDIGRARDAARQAVLNALAIVERAVGLERVVRCVRLNGYVASDPGFHDQPAVLDAASELLKEVFGDKGLHTRTAVGVAALPRNAPIEIDLVFELR